MGAEFENPLGRGNFPSYYFIPEVPGGDDWEWQIMFENPCGGDFFPLLYTPGVSGGGVANTSVPCSPSSSRTLLKGAKIGKMINGRIMKR